MNDENFDMKEMSNDWQSPWAQLDMSKEWEPLVGGLKI